MPLECCEAGGLTQFQQTGDADAVAAGLPTDPFGLVAAEIDLRAGAVGSTIAEADKSLAAEAAGNDVMLVKIVS